ncbi:hypothetical protein RchiOBHm_Chr7g0242971 [Rosa chinensis]|uniref:Uncharacterized protein n=1 Tax=Rosa chinensis TaxID=74649 RepID=A0A2P6PIL6_ROSCH|nr:hypothetical protein RchiOBHm_Chr7g0242971 [Rosa chinensis]
MLIVVQFFCFHSTLDLAWDLLQRCPNLAFTITKPPDKTSPMLKLARMHFAFLSGTRLTCWQRWLYDLELVIIWSWTGESGLWMRTWLLFVCWEVALCFVPQLREADGGLVDDFSLEDTELIFIYRFSIKIELNLPCHELQCLDMNFGCCPAYFYL